MFTLQFITSIICIVVHTHVRVRYLKTCVLMCMHVYSALCVCTYAQIYKQAYKQRTAAEIQPKKDTMRHIYKLAKMIVFWLLLGKVGYTSLPTQTSRGRASPNSRQQEAPIYLNVQTSSPFDLKT